VLEYAAYAEYNSNHPIAKSIFESYDREFDSSRIGKVQEISGYGLKASIDNKEILVGMTSFFIIKMLNTKNAMWQEPLFMWLSTKNMQAILLYPTA